MAEEQHMRGLVRVIELATDQDRATMNSLIEWETIDGMSAGAGAVPSASTSDGDTVAVLEPYGFASSPPGTAQAVVLAPGADDENRVALGVSSVSGRPATDAGDSVQWTEDGNSLVMDNDGGITLTARSTGSITINAGAGASITINVDGGQSVKCGGPGAVPVLKAQATETYLVNAANGVTSVDPNIEAAFLQFGGALLGLADAAKTAKLEGE